MHFPQYLLILIVLTWSRQAWYAYLIHLAVCGQSAFCPFLLFSQDASQTLHPSLGILCLKTYCSAEVQQMLLVNSRKNSTWYPYLQKWKRLNHWYDQRHLSSTHFSLSTVLDYCSIRVRWTAIMAFPSPGERFSVFTHPTTEWFIKELRNLVPQIKEPAPVWDLNLVHKCLMRPPFEPIAICSLFNLFIKMAFLVAMTSARRVQEIVALMADPPFTVISPRDKILL